MIDKKFIHLEEAKNILQGISEGKPMKHIAKDRNVDPRTMQKVISRLADKYNCDTTYSLIALYIKNGWIEGPNTVQDQSMENGIIQSFAEGKTYRQIAIELNLKPRKVLWIIAKLKSKYDCKSNYHLMSLFLKIGLIQGPLNEN